MFRDRSVSTTASTGLSKGVAVHPAVRHPDILVVNELFPPAIGGSAVLLHEIYRRLTGRSVVVLTDEHSSPGPSPEVLGPLTVVRRSIATRKWGVADPGGAWHHAAVGGRVRAMAGRRSTIVHCGRALPEGIAAWVSHRLWGPRYLCWSHGEDVTSAMTSRELVWVMTRVYRSAAAVIANSQSTRALVLSLGLRADRVHVVHPGVDPTRFHPGVDARDLRDALLNGGHTLLLSVGRLQRRKGHDITIAAVAALRESCPGLRYVVVGDGEERRHLEALVAEHRLGDRVVFVGAVLDEELPRYFAATDVFVMPNRRDGADIEGFGIVFLEAAASGKPAIGGASGGVAEAIDDSRTGVLVSGTNVPELAQAIRTLAEDPAKRDALGRAGRARVLRGFTWDHSAAQVAVIHDAVAQWA